MAERRFFCERLQAGRVSLAEAEAHHARNVLRVRVGDAVRLFDGAGTEAVARVEAIGRKGVELLVERIQPADPQGRPLPVTLAVAMPKAARQDMLIEKCTELGVQAIRPIITRRGVARPGRARLEHWRQVSIAAAKQSGRSYLPRIAEPMIFDHLLTLLGDFAMALYGSTDPQAPPLLDGLIANDMNVPRASPPSAGKGCRQDACGTAEGGSHKPAAGILMVIGPEGGLTPNEEVALIQAGAKPISLGGSVLRVETAAIAALAVVGAWLARKA
jgi:16S rRNA (uracil1498-N3)-methyltransferase